MNPSFPAPLRERLGDPALAALDEVLAIHRTDLAVLLTASLERRLTAECLRGRTEVRAEMSGVRLFVHDEIAGLRAAATAAAAREARALRRDLRRWSAICWLGQAGAIAALTAWLR